MGFEFTGIIDLMGFESTGIIDLIIMFIITTCKSMPGINLCPFRLMTAEEK